MAALSWQELPAFMSELSVRDGMSARTLEFIILTATRSGEARGARWCEVSGDVWTIPAMRMKRGIEHRVPLSEEALNILERQKGFDSELIFPSLMNSSEKIAKEQSVMVFKSLLKRMKHDDITVHGFRSTFRDWCSESARVSRDVAEAALSHATGNAVERAYARSDLFERRRDLMNRWSAFATGDTGKVLHLVNA